MVALRSGLALLVLSLLGFAAAGCGDDGGRGAPLGATGTTSAAVAATSSGGASTSSTGSAATGSAAAPAASGPDTAPPDVRLASPARGAHVTQGVVAVEGTVTDATGVAYLVIDGTPVLPGAGGAFRHVVAVNPGLNVIEIEAADPLAHRTRLAVPVVAGSFLPTNQAVGDALVARLNRPAFDAIERLVAAQLGGANLGQLVMSQNPLFSGGGGAASLQVDATAASFGVPTVDLDPQSGGLGVHVELPAIDVTTRTSGRVLGVPYGVTVSVTATKATVDATAVVDVQPGGVVQTRLTNVTVALDGFRFDIRHVPGFLESLARGAVRRLIEDQVRRQVEDVVPREVNRAIAGANGPIVQNVLGRPVTLHLVPAAVTFDAQGAAVRAHGDLTVTPPPGRTPPATPGSLATQGAPPVLGTQPALLLSVDDDLLNRMAHAAWRGGLMNMKVDQAQAAAWGLPAWLQLDAFLLQVFFPALAGQLNPGDPLEVEVSSGTPALFRTLAAPDLLEAGVGDLTVDVYVAPAGQPRLLVLSVATQVSVGVRASVASNVLRVDVTGRPLIKSDVVATPVAPLDDLAVENFIDFVLPPVIQILPRAWSGLPLPIHPGLSPTGVRLAPDGPSGDYVTLSGDL